jgi:hypothetical protein
VRSYISNYVDQFDLYRHLPDRASLEPYDLRLSRARDDCELIGMLFPPAALVEGTSATSGTAR